MGPLKDIERIIKKARLKTLEELHNRVIKDVLNAQAESQKLQPISTRQNIGRIIMKSKIVKLTTAAGILLVIILGMNFFDTPIGNASKVYAAAMDSIKKARTFAYTEVEESPNRNGEDKENETFLFKQTYMYKEPNWERWERPRGPWGEVVNEVVITHYDERQRLLLNFVDKTAVLHDMSSDYTIDYRTGGIRLTQLNTNIRDSVLKDSMGTFEDLGYVELDGKSVLMCQTEKNGRLTTLWIDPKTNYPVQIEYTWPGQKREPVLLTSIKIDEEIDDSLFSLEPPEGFTVRFANEPQQSDYKIKLDTKIMHLGRMCLIYANKYDDKLPDKFEDFVTSGIVTEDALKNILAAPDDPNGTPIFRYRKPDSSTLGTDDMSVEVMVYEDYEGKGIDEQVMVTMLDLHSELLPVQSLKHLLKPWPVDEKILAIRMTRLHWFCIQYAKEHNGEFPVSLEKLVGENFSEDRLKELRTSDNTVGPDVVQYKVLSKDADLSAEVMFYQIYETWPEDGAMVCYGDGNCEIITDQSEFEELIK